MALIPALSEDLALFPDLRAAGPDDAVNGKLAKWVAEPVDGHALAAVLAAANTSNLRAVIRGNGTKMGWGNARAALDLIVSTSRMNAVVEHAAADMTATVQAGCMVESFQQALATKSQRLAIDPLWPRSATIGGILAANDSGSLRTAFGSLRDLLIGITIALPDGTLARSGGKVVKNVAGYDLPKLMIGSFGTLAAIVEATFRLHPLPLETRSIAFDIRRDRLGEVACHLGEASLLLARAQVEMNEPSEVRLTLGIESLRDAIDEKCHRVLETFEKIGCQRREPSADCWLARQRLFDDAQAWICKIAMLPGYWTRLAGLVLKMREESLSPRLVAQLAGGGTLSLTGASERVIQTIEMIRAEAIAAKGSLMVLRYPEAARVELDPWGPPGDSLSLMKRIKAQFDPKGTLAQGRFIGGI